MAGAARWPEGPRKKRGGKEKKEKKKKKRKRKKKKKKKRKGFGLGPPRGGGQALPGAKHAKGPVLRHKLSISVAKLKAPF